MKKVTALVFSLFAAVFSVKAAGEAINDHYSGFYNGSSYIFVEGGVEFSVFPDGQFDFVYLGNRGASNVNVSINTPGVSINYNSGYNYDAFVQYDDYGAVIQVEDVPIYYDQFGRIVQAGSVEINYVNRRIVRVGGLQIFYNPYGYFSHCTGYISPYYMTYVYRPWHVYYVRPLWNHCVVYDYPYRRYYHPIRYTYAYHSTHYNRGRSNYNNGRREFYRPGSRVHYKDGRTAVNRDYNPNRRNTMVASREENRGSQQVANRNTSRSNQTNARATERQTTRPVSETRTANRSTQRTVSSNRGTAQTNTKRQATNQRSTQTTHRSSSKKVWEGRSTATQAKASSSSSRSSQRTTAVKSSRTQQKSTVNKRAASTTKSSGSATRGSSGSKRGRG